MTASLRLSCGTALCRGRPCYKNPLTLQMDSPVYHPEGQQIGYRVYVSCSVVSNSFETSWTVARLPRRLSGKESACNAGDASLIPGSGRPPAGGHGNPLQCSRLENPIDRRAWQSKVHGVAKSWTQLSNSLTCHAGGFGFGLCPESNKAV